MKKIITIIVFVLAFSVNANAQEAKKACCSAHKTASTEAVTKEQSTTVSTEKHACNADNSCCGGKTVSQSATKGKAKTASTGKHVCDTDHSCCAGGKTPPKKA